MVLPFGGFLKWGYPQNAWIYDGKNPNKNGIRTGGAPYDSGNLHFAHESFGDVPTPKDSISPRHQAESRPSVGSSCGPWHWSRKCGEDDKLTTLPDWECQVAFAGNILESLMIKCSNDWRSTESTSSELKNHSLVAGCPIPVVANGGANGTKNPLPSQMLSSPQKNQEKPNLRNEDVHPSGHLTLRIECMSFAFHSPTNPRRSSSLNPVVARVARRFWREKNSWFTYQRWGFP